MKENKYKIVYISLIVALGGLLMGFDASVISGVIKFIESDFNLSKIQLGWAVSSLTLTSTLAMFIAGPLSDKYGRRLILKYSAILYAISAIYSALSINFTHLIIARMIGGLGVGSSLIIAPMYIAENSPPKLRGRMVSFNQLNIVIGISLAFFSNYFILNLSNNNYFYNSILNNNSWRIMLGVEFIPAILYLIALFFVPKSIRWLIMNNKVSDAKKVIKSISTNTNIDNEIKEIQLSISSESNENKFNFKVLFNPIFNKILIIGIVIAILQQITGINSVFFYAPMIFEQTGIGTNASFSQAILIGVINIIFTVLAISLIDKIGRRPLLIFGVSLITISMLTLSYTFNKATYKISDDSFLNLPEEIANSEKIDNILNIEYSNDILFKQALKKTFGENIANKYESDLIKLSIKANSLIILIAILSFVASFAISLGPVMWVLLSELFPNKIRGIAISFVGLINSSVSFVVQFLFPWELSNLGSSLTFLIYGLFALLGIIFVYFKIPETKGKSLEDLEKLLVK